MNSNPALIEKASQSTHPFILEKLYRMIATTTTGGDLRDPEQVLAPILDTYLRMRDAFFVQAYQSASTPQRAGIMDAHNQPWWFTMPFILPPYESHHELALMYAQYRLMTSGNMTFLVGTNLSKALFNTDFSIDMGDLHIPADTFTVYYKDSSIPVGTSTLRWLFVDRVALSDHRFQFRILYGYVDEDDDWANSDFFLFDYDRTTRVESSELFDLIDRQEVSDLSRRKVTEENRTSSRNILTALFNFLLYITATDDRRPVVPPDYTGRLATLRNPKKRRRIQKRIADETVYQYTYVGSSYEARSASGQAGDEKNLAHRVLVRGHWRHQWFGPQRDDEGNRIPGTSQRLIWVEPYWKGPDDVDGKLRVRVVR